MHVPAAPGLSELIHNRRWVRRTDPFPHITAARVFRDAFYEELASAFRAILERGVGEQRGSGRLSRSMPGYDAYGMTFPPEQCWPLSVFMSRSWHDMLAALFHVNATGHINCGLHHHPVGSADGWIHNDLNPGWFVNMPSADGIQLVRHEICSYAFGETRNTKLKPVETVRAVAMLYYLANPAWSAGEGGSTGLYRAKDDAVNNPVAVVPPVNNSILAFECTPYSFHTFISNWLHPRNCVIMWLHRPKAEVVERWGEHKIVKWPRRQA